MKTARNPSNSSTIAGLETSIRAILRTWETQQLLTNLDKSPVEKTIHNIMALVRKNHINSHLELLNHSNTILKHMTGLEKLHQFTDSETSRVANFNRNILAALIAQFSINNNQAPKNALGQLPTMMPENGEPGRAAHDDEILLLRICALHRLQRKGTAKIPAIRYILVEAGAYPSETTVVTRDNFDFSNPHAPTVTLPGVGTNDIRAKKRKVNLPSWASEDLEDAIHELLARSITINHNQPIAYTGLHIPGGHSASAAASSNIGRFCEESGLGKRGLTALSPNRWQLTKVLQTQGFAAAQTLGGKPHIDNLMNHLHNPQLIRKRPTTRLRGNITHISIPDQREKNGTVI
jgi:hypothetical protein